MTTYKDLAGSYASATGAMLYVKSMINGQEVGLKAFLTNLSQDFKSNWTQENVFGRMDPISTFQNTTRTVAVSLNVPAASVSEAMDNQAKFGKLAKMLYPAYMKSSSGDSSFNMEENITAPMLSDVPSAESVSPLANPTAQSGGALTMAKSPLVRVKLGNLIRSQDGTDGLLGWIDGFSFKPTLSLGMFAEGGGAFYAKNYELSFTLNVLHEDDIGTDSSTGTWLGGTDDSFPF